MPIVDPSHSTREYLDAVSNALQAIAPADVVRIIECLQLTYDKDGCVLIAGNGGSAATASHMANDLTMTVRRFGAPGFRAVSLADNVAVLTAAANDVSYDQIFEMQIRALARSGDLLLVLSASGNSPNIVRALECAHDLGLTSVALLGMGGGRAARLADVSIVVSSSDYGPIEDAHLVLNHLITAHFAAVLPRSLR